MASSNSSFEPGDELEQEWDVIVIGTGMGGSTLGYSLARRGKRVLFLEKGKFLLGPADRGGDGSFRGESDGPAERLAEGRWPFKIEGETSFGPMEFFAPLGCGSGGSTNLYAAQLERLMPSDFEPGRYFSQYEEASVVDTWPITYDELVPYYRQAESLFRVCGSQDPLNVDEGGNLASPPPLSERDAYLKEALTEVGLHPYRAHVGCQFVPGCTGCGSTICPRQCKSDAGTVALLPALRDHGARLCTDAEVTRLEASSSRVDAVVFRRGEQEHRVRGKVVVLAAGALMTPILLLRSASSVWPNGLSNRSGQVGHNLMMHTSDFVALRPPKRLSPEGPHKGLSLNDFYVKDGVKMGNLQSAGMKVNAGLINYYLKSRAEREPKWYLKIGKVGRKVASHVGAELYKQANVFATVVEDLPYFENRVELDPASPNGMKFVYRYPQELAERNARFQLELKRAVASRLTVLPIRAGDNNLNFGHSAGTCRSGNDHDTSVVDKYNRSHDIENLYIADASAFPSSGGINPSLTIAARALQVADAVHSQN